MKQTRRKVEYQPAPFKKASNWWAYPGRTMRVTRAPSWYIVRQLICAELQRLCWPTRHLKVSKTSEACLVNVGPLCGLDPNKVWGALKKLKSGAGQKEILRVLGKLEELVEI
jgi:hypothetical protein